MKLLFTLFFLTFSLSLNSQPNNTVKTNPQTETKLSIEIDRLQRNIDANRKEQQNSENELKKDLKEEISEYKERTRDLVNIYVYLISAGIFVIGFLITWLGKSAIKARVEELITETIQKHAEDKIVQTLNSKITSELIESAIKNKSQDEIDKILDSIKNEGFNTIKSLEQRGNEAIKKILSAPPKPPKVKKAKYLTDIEISAQNDILRANEFFKIAYENTENQRIKIELYKNVLEITPDNFTALNNLAVSHINLNELELAIEALTKSIKINPEYAIAYVNRARAYNLLNMLDEAMKDLDSAFKIDPNFEFIYVVKGNILTKRGKFEEAEIELNNAIQINPDSAEAHFNRAYFYEERNEFDKSETDYKMAESLGLENKSMLYNNMAVLYRRKKEFDTAIQFLEKARSFSPVLPNIDGTLALIYADKNDDENFYKYLQIALEKGCAAWNYLNDKGFEKYRETDKLKKLLEAYKKKYFA